MNCKETLIAAVTGISLLAATPAVAGGPIITEDTETAAPRERNVLPFIIIGALVVAGLLAGGGDCYQPEPEAPEGGC